MTEIEELREKVKKIIQEHEADLNKIPSLDYMTAESKDRTDCALRHKLLAFREVLEMMG